MKEDKQKTVVRAWLFRLLADLEENTLNQAQRKESGRTIVIEVEFGKKEVI